MIQLEDCFLWGQLVSKYSFNGDVLVNINVGDPNQYLHIKTCFVLIEGTLVPYFITNHKVHKTHLMRVHFDGIEMEQATKPLIGKEVYLPLEVLSTIKLEGKYTYHQYIGYKVFDSNTFLGIVQDILGDKQLLFSVLTDTDTAILIPIVTPFIQRIDTKKQTIFMVLPEGLIDINS